MAPRDGHGVPTAPYQAGTARRDGSILAHGRLCLRPPSPRPRPQSKPRQLCFFAFLPDILDTGAKGRNEYLQILRDLASK
jgi:hypothetical protein